MSGTKSIKAILADIRRDVDREKLEGCKVVTWEDMVTLDVPVIPMPSPRINAALGVGGLPLGRIVEIFGPEAGGKTTLALHAAAMAQRQGLTTAYIDMEHALDPRYCNNLGVDMNKLIVSQPDTGDDALSLAKILVENGVSLIVIDSVSALLSREELKKGITDANVGLQARMMSQGLRQLVPSVARSQSCIVFTNQVREKVSFMGGETTPGGRALKHTASIRIRIGRISPATDESKTQISRVKIVKNKLSAPFKTCDVEIVYGFGLDGLSETVKFAKEIKLIKSGGPYMTMPHLDCPGLKNHKPEDVIKLQGMDKAKHFVETTEGYLEALRAKSEEYYEQQRAGSQSQG